MTALYGKFYPILRWPVKSKKLWLLICPPFFHLYLVTLTVFFMEKRRHAAWLAAMAGTIFLLTEITYLVLFISHSGFLFERTAPLADAYGWIFLGNHAFVFFAKSFLIIWYANILPATIYSVKFERSLNPDKHYSSADWPQYAVRYFTFLFLPYTLWSYQRILQAAFEKEALLKNSENVS